jgi:isochorismate hydrolase
MRLEKVETIGLVIDIQERLVPVMYKKDEFVSNSGKLIMGLQELNVPLLVTQQYTKGLGDTVSEISTLVSHFTYTEKTSFSCLDEPLFKDVLQKSGAKNVIICGIESHICVLQTAIDLKASGYNPVIVFDCVSSRSEQDMKLAFERFRYEGIMVTGTESLLFELVKNVKDVSFKNISKLVK